VRLAERWCWHITWCVGFGFLVEPLKLHFGVKTTIGIGLMVICVGAAMFFVSYEDKR
jgi:hypothetical protein